MLNIDCLHLCKICIYAVNWVKATQVLVSVIKDHRKFGILSQKQGPVMNGMHDNINFKNTKSNKICLVDLLICTSKSTKCDYKLIP